MRSDRVQGALPLNGIFAGNPSDVFLKCLEEVQAISCATLFSPVTRQEAVQAMGENGGNYMRERNADFILYSSGVRVVRQRLAERWTCRPNGHGTL